MMTPVERAPDSAQPPSGGASGAGPAENHLADERPGRGFWLLMVLSLGFVGSLALLQYLRVDAARRGAGREEGASVIGAKAPPPLPVIAEAPSFLLTDRTGRGVSRDDLRGRVWVANFIFTNCAGPCPVMSIRMKEIQDRLKGLKYEDVACVSFTVDPDRDTSEVLDAYAKALGAELGRWLFLTGEKKTLRALAIDGFKITVQDPEQGDDQIIHSTRMVLVDRLGRIRGYYSAMTEAEEEDPRIAGTEGGMPSDVRSRLLSDIARLRMESSR